MKPEDVYSIRAAVKESEGKSKIPTLAGESYVLLGFKGAGDVAYGPRSEIGDEYSGCWFFRGERSVDRKKNDYSL